MGGEEETTRLTVICTAAAAAAAERRRIGRRMQIREKLEGVRRVCVMMAHVSPQRDVCC